MNKHPQGSLATSEKHQKRPDLLYVKSNPDLSSTGKQENEGALEAQQGTPIYCTAKKARLLSKQASEIFQSSPAFLSVRLSVGRVAKKKRADVQP